MIESSTTRDESGERSSEITLVPALVSPVTYGSAVIVRLATEKPQDDRLDHTGNGLPCLLEVKTQ